jgi:lysyl-tRNA synthetase class 2
MSIPQFAAQYGAVQIDKGAKLEEVQSLAGRVYNKRAAGASLIFYDLQSQGGKIQVIADRKADSDDWEIHSHIK